MKIYEGLEMYTIHSEPRYWMDLNIRFTPRHVIPKIGPSLQSVQKRTMSNSGNEPQLSGYPTTIIVTILN